MSIKNKFNYTFIEQEAFNYLTMKYLPSKFDQFSANTERKINLTSYLIERTISKVGIISSYKVNNFIDQKFLKDNKISAIGDVCAIINKYFSFDVIYFFKNNVFDAIEIVGADIDLSKQVHDVEILTIKEFNELLKSNSTQGKRIRENFG